MSQERATSEQYQMFLKDRSQQDLAKLVTELSRRRADRPFLREVYEEMQRRQPREDSMASSRRTKADPASPVLHVIENKREKFRRLGNARGKTLIKRMRLMGNLGGKGYEAGPEQIELIVKVLTGEFDEMVVRLRQGAKPDTIGDLL